MSKRPNPFGDSSPLQFKTHVGKKEVDLGVCRDERMKDVYQKTKDLLFKGAQKTENYTVDVNSNQIPWQPNGEGDKLKPIPGQMYIDKNCHLKSTPTLNDQTTESSNNTPNVPHNFQFSSKPNADTTCLQCSQPFSQQAYTKCYFCDKKICGKCVRNCCNCEERFCQMCSFLNYDEAMVRAFCFNCAT